MVPNGEITEFNVNLVVQKIEERTNYLVAIVNNMKDQEPPILDVT